MGTRWQLETMVHPSGMFVKGETTRRMLPPALRATPLPEGGKLRKLFNFLNQTLQLCNPATSSAPLREGGAPEGRGENAQPKSSLSPRNQSSRRRGACSPRRFAPPPSRRGENFATLQTLPTKLCNYATLQLCNPTFNFSPRPAGRPPPLAFRPPGGWLAKGPIAVLRRRRGGGRGRCPGRPGGASCGTPHGSAWRRGPSSRRGRRGCRPKQDRSDR